MTLMRQAREAARAGLSAVVPQPPQAAMAGDVLVSCFESRIMYQMEGSTSFPRIGFKRQFLLFGIPVAGALQILEMDVWVSQNVGIKMTRSAYSSGG